MTNLATASEIKHFEELHLDRISVDSTLNAALRFHSNRINEVEKAFKQLWESIYERFPALREEMLETGKAIEMVSVDGIVVYRIKEDD